MEPFSRAYEHFAVDAQVLAAIGRLVLTNPDSVATSLPTNLADSAVAAWNRDELDELPSQETEQQWLARHRAGSLALIGLAIESVGYSVGDEMTVVLPLDLRAEAIKASVELSNRAQR